ncbi:hypothetical protein HOT31_gp084 [Microbacterium phage Hendrix]|uniref:Uncharacterized protein n=1 Tax=Microbacterium phage Hendrix TaxID=2182341 RepID=A0A2U8UU76_9CAUD|nr:hypothetical protein HOT31_gp084 [Microbacterium phage Hendrix]AWN07755.1 hypothetical protein PBI_HENDRIX_84 [Microbacterium phage Hendrix]
MSDEKVQYRHQVIEKWVSEFRPSLTDSNIKTFLEEFVIEWEEAEQAQICDHCGDPLDGTEPEMIDEQDGTLAHSECLAEAYRDPREDSGYWKED